ncbi:hypothetical protein AAG906_030433 [Vitis piasezkii]
MLAPQITLFQPPSLFTIRRSQSPEPRKNSKTWKSNCKSPTNFLCFSLKTSSSTTEFSNSLREVRRVHAVVLKCLDNSVTYVNNNLISAYLRFGKLVEARKVFDKMPERNVVSWTAVVNGYSRYGFDDEALRLFNDCIENGVRANGKTFVCVLNLCSKRLDFELGRQIHACIVKDNWRNLIVDSALVYFYAQCGDLSGAFHAFDQMPERDVVCWTTMITACSQQGRGTEALSMFSQMIFNTSSPNEFTVCSVLKACGEEKALEFGKQLHGAIIKKMFKEDVFIGTSLVGMYAKCGEILDSRKVFDGMKKRNTVTWTSIIAGYARNGQGEEAISLFRVMKRRKIFANNLTVVSILRACGSTRNLLMGKEVHAQIMKNSMQSNIYIGSTLVWFYCKCEEHPFASKVLQNMPLRDVVSWTAIISGYTSLGHEPEALEFLKEMLEEGVEPNPFTYSSALKACAHLEAILQGKLIHSSVNKTLALSNVFAMIVGYARNGLCGEALKLMYRMQAEGIEVDDYILTTVLSACGDVEWNMESSSDHCLQSNCIRTSPTGPFCSIIRKAWREGSVHLNDEDALENLLNLRASGNILCYRSLKGKRGFGMISYQYYQWKCRFVSLTVFIERYCMLREINRLRLIRLKSPHTSSAEKILLLLHDLEFKATDAPLGPQVSAIALQRYEQ